MFQPATITHFHSQLGRLLHDPSHKELLSLILTRNELCLTSFGERNNNEIILLTLLGGAKD